MVGKGLPGLFAESRWMQLCLVRAHELGDRLAPQALGGLVGFEDEPGFDIGKNRGVVHMVKQQVKTLLRVFQLLLDPLHQGAVAQTSHQKNRGAVLVAQGHAVGHVRAVGSIGALHSHLNIAVGRMV